MGGYATLPVPHVSNYVNLSSICLYKLIRS